MDSSNDPVWDDLQRICALAGIPAMALVRQVAEAADSIHFTRQLIAFHVHECRLALERQMPSSSGTVQAVLATLQYVHRDGIGQGDVAMAAHHLAALQNLRNAYDYLAQICNVLLLPAPLPAHTCDLNKLLDVLPDSVFQKKLNAIANGSDFQHAKSLNNLVKHCRVTRTYPHVDLVSGEAKHLVQGFAKSGKKQVQTFDREDVHDSLQRIERLTAQLTELLKDLREQLDGKQKGA